MSWPLKIGPTGSPETSVSNHLTPRNNSEDGWIKKKLTDVSKGLHTSFYMLQWKLRPQVSHKRQCIYTSSHCVKFPNTGMSTRFDVDNSCFVGQVMKRDVSFECLVLSVRFRKVLGSNSMTDCQAGNFRFSFVAPLLRHKSWLIVHSLFLISH